LRAGVGEIDEKEALGSEGVVREQPEEVVHDSVEVSLHDAHYACRLKGREVSMAF
jgi:hypothetical protein